MQIRRPLCLLAAFFTILLFFIGKLPGQEDPPPVRDRENVLVTGCVSRREQKDERFTYDLKQVTVYHNMAGSAALSNFETIIKKRGSLKILVATEGDEVLCIGERVALSGSTSLFEAAENEGQFDSASYYGKKGYAFRIFRGKVLFRDHRYLRIREGMQRWKEETAAFFASVLGSSQGSVLSAMVLGEKKGMDREIRDLYRQNGIAHILAISGLHISLLGLFLYKGLRRLGAGIVFCAVSGMGLVLFYGFLVGATSSVVRASVMLSMQIFGDLVNRSYDMLTAMAVSGLLLLTVFPEYLTDAGFLLSFLAVLGIALVTPALGESGRMVQKVFGKKPGTLSGRMREKKPGEMLGKICKKMPGKMPEKIWEKIREKMPGIMPGKKHEQASEKTSERESKVAEALCISLGVALTTLPVLLWYYFEFPLYAILLNLLLVPLMGAVLISGITAALVRVSFLLMPAWAVLTLYEAVCRVCSTLPWHLIRTGRPEVWKIVVYYLALALFAGIREGLKIPGLDGVYRNEGDGLNMSGRDGVNRTEGGGSSMPGINKVKMTETDGMNRSGVDSGKIVGAKNDRHKSDGNKLDRNKMVYITKSAMLIAALLLLLSGGRRENRVDMLSVGQGDCIVLRDEKGHVVICDGGSSDVSEVGTYRLIPYLKYHGITKIDAVYLSHPHEDHYTALIELFAKSREEGFRIGTLYVSDRARSDPQYASVLEGAKSAGIRTAVVSPGQTQSFGDINLLVCYPDRHPVSDDTNDQSMVLVGRMKDFSMLLTGDATSLTDDALLSCLQKAGIETVSCLKAEHHGSREANSKRLLTFLKPDITIISCGKDNRYGHPHPETLERLQQAGSRYYVTSQTGQIMIGVRGSGFSVRGFSGEKDR
ncbi:MAG: ComEC/Rec2 family competence protein [Lachnospiraceae bacterium]|nr:ComEC/Rec2 family competence protein [Lachnospiraceae bacterium]